MVESAADADSNTQAALQALAGATEVACAVATAATVQSHGQGRSVVGEELAPYGRQVHRRARLH
eukprot:10928178-Lingulodinium_polyedra.AAC.1